MLISYIPISLSLQPWYTESMGLFYKWEKSRLGRVGFVQLLKFWNCRESVSSKVQALLQIAVPYPQASAVLHLELFKMCIINWRWWHAEWCQYLKDGGRRTRSYSQLHASSRPAWSAQRPFLRKGMGWMGCVHGTEYMGCLPRETEAWKSLKLRSLRPAWVEQKEFIHANILV